MQARGFDEAGRSYLGVRILGDTGELVPVDAAIEPDPEPTSVPDIRRHEETFLIGLDEHLLHSVRGSAPNGEATVAVVICQHHQERALFPHEERRRPVAEPLARLRKRETDRAQLRQHLRLLPLCGTAHALMVAEVDDQPRRRRRRSNAEVNLVREADRPAQHRFEVTSPDDLLYDRRARGRAVDALRSLVDHDALARVQVEARGGLHTNDHEGIALELDRIPGPVFLQRRLDVLDLVTRQRIRELEDDAVISFVSSYRHPLEQSGVTAARCTLDRRRRGTRKRIDPAGTARHRRCR